MLVGLRFEPFPLIADGLEPETQGMKALPSGGVSRRLDQPSTPTLMVMPHRIEPFEQQRVRCCRRGEYQFPYSLRDLFRGPCLPECSHLFVNPGVYQRKVGSARVDRDQVLSKDL